VITLYDADRCPYCARVRIVLAEKGVPYETVAIDLADRPAWLYEKNPAGRVPVLEEDGFCLPESAVIMELLEDRFPDPPLLSSEPAERSLARLAIWRFDTEFGDDYYAARRGEDGAEGRFASRLAELEARLVERPFLAGGSFGLADIAWFPWLPRAEGYLGLDFAAYPATQDWLGRLAVRPPIAAELEIVAARAA
jgi:glutathione S-transferase